MTITDDIKAKIEAEYKQWENMQYGGKDKKERQKMSQFFTPPVLTIRMLEKFENLEGTILDPTCGAGGLIAAAIIAGADPKKCYGIELDPDVAALARARLAKLGVPRHHIHVGNALEASSYEFPEPKGSYSITLKRDCGGLKMTLSIADSKKTIIKQVGIMSRSNVEMVHKWLDVLISKELEETPEAFKSIATLNRLFAKHGLAEV